MSGLRHRNVDVDSGPSDDGDIAQPSSTTPVQQVVPQFSDTRIYQETAQGKLRRQQHDKEHNLGVSSSGLPCSIGTSALLVSIICAFVMWFLTRPENPETKIFHPTVLAMYNGEGPNAMYISILGQVFDVTKGKQYYGKGQGYNCFVGRDASRAFMTGEFEKDITDDVLDLPDEDLMALVGWLEFYHKKYVYRGRLQGRYYDAKGNELPELKKVHEAAARGKLAKEEADKHKEVYPPCNSSWAQDTGGIVSCDNGRYPRKIQEVVSGAGGGPRWRCACFEQLGWSDLRQVYDDCDPDAHQCQVSPPLAVES